MLTPEQIELLTTRRCLLVGSLFRAAVLGDTDELINDDELPALLAALRMFSHRRPSA